MPRIKKTYDQAMDTELSILIKSYLERRNRPYGDLPDIIRCCRNTAGKKIKHPGTLTIDELRRIKRSLQIPAEDLAKCI